MGVITEQNRIKPNFHRTNFFVWRLVGKEPNSHAFNSGVMSLDVFVYYGGFYTEFKPYQITQEKRFPLARSSVTTKPRN